MSLFAPSDDSVHWDLGRWTHLSSDFGIIFAASTAYEAYLFALLSHHIESLTLLGSATTEREALDLVVESAGRRLLCLVSDGVSNISGSSIASGVRSSNPDSISILIVNDIVKFHVSPSAVSAFDGCCSASTVGRGGLIRCLDSILLKGTPFTDPFLVKSPSGLPDAAATSLTHREREVLSFLSIGLTNQQISSRMFIAERTARDYVASILSKLGLPNRAAVASWAAKHGLAP